MILSSVSFRLLAVVSCVLVSSLALAQPATPPPATDPAMTPPPPPPPMPPPQSQLPPTYLEPAPRPAVLGPARLAAVPNQAPPVGYHEVQENTPGLIVAGSITFGVTWVVFNLFPGLIASSAGCGECGFLMIPVVGPVVLGIASNNITAQSGLIGLLAIDTIVQAGGMAMLIAGLAITKTVWVRDYRPLSVVPILTPGMQGLAIGGAF